VKASSYIKHRIGVRATQLMLLHGISTGKLMKREDAQRLAARELAAEQRKQQQNNKLAPMTGPVTVHNARAHLLNQLTLIGERLRTAPRRRNRLPREPEVVRPHTKDVAPVSPPPQPAPASEPVLIFNGRATLTELIADCEFHSSVHDLTTANWRRSITRNQRLAQQRRGLWIG
jgi:hypothetical protein